MTTLELPDNVKPLVRATLLRIARRIAAGDFDGEIHIIVGQGNVRSVRWTYTETGESLKEELG